MRYIAIPSKVVAKYWQTPFLELVELATAGVDGLCDAEILDRMLWRALDPSEAYDGVLSPRGRRRLSGFAIFVHGEPWTGGQMNLL